MTAGEQIIYKYKREIWESEENAKEEEKKRIAKSLKDLKVAVDTIVKSTGLAQEQIEAL